MDTANHTRRRKSGHVFLQYPYHINLRYNLIYFLYFCHMLLQNTTVVNHSSTIITKYTEYTCMKESKMHYQTKEDAELWVLLIKGDKLALEIMYRRYFPHLLNYGHTISTNEELIKDCIQDLFVNVFNNSKFRPIDHVKSYLYTALRNWKDSLHTTILIWKEANC